MGRRAAEEDRINNKSEKKRSSVCWARGLTVMGRYCDELRAGRQSAEAASNRSHWVEKKDHYSYHRTT
jgi:hypothetical protein